MESLIAEARIRYHKRLLDSGVLTIDKGEYLAMQIRHLSYRSRLQKVLLIN